MMQVRAPFSWFGGKQDMAPLLASLLPPHEVYVEVFGGAAALLWAKQPATHEIYNDVDSGLVNFFRVLRSQGEELKAALELTPYSREEYNDCWHRLNEQSSPVEQARRWFVVVTQGFAARADHMAGWAYSLSNKRRASTYSNLVQALPWFQRRLRHIQVDHLDFAKVFTNYDTPATVFYADPPYLQEVRSEGGYRHEMSEVDHIRLLETITTLQGKVLLSGYDSPLYRAYLGDWQCIKKRVYCTADNRTRKPRVECIWLSPNIRRQPSLWEVTA